MRPRRGELTGPNPVDRGKPGTKYHLVMDAGGIPLAVGCRPPTPTTPSCSQLVDAVPAIIGPRGRPGRPRRRPAKLHADKAYDCPTLPPGAAPSRDHAADRPPRDGVLRRLGRHRWKVERSLAWLLANRRLTVRYERRADVLIAFLHLACALICARKLTPL